MDKRRRKNEGQTVAGGDLARGSTDQGAQVAEVPRYEDAQVEPIEQVEEKIEEEAAKTSKTERTSTQNRKI